MEDKGQKLTLQGEFAMSALTPKAEIMNEHAK